MRASATKMTDMYCSSVFMYVSLVTTVMFTDIRSDTTGLGNIPAMSSDSAITNCGSLLKSPKGVIATPSFPKAYPLPMFCRWVIEAPSDKVVALYFTQYFMREGLTVSEYAFFSESMYLGKKEFGVISSDREPTFLISNKPVLVLEFDIREIGNVHLRVREHLLDVFGFNITYEMIGRNESVKKDLCLYNHCSFTGSCVTTSSKFEKYYCKCFDDYFGTECQYNRDCGPKENGDFCSNGGTCRYYIGSTVKSCECPPGFEGNRCENKKDPRLPAQCVSLGCTQTCFLTSKGDYRCSCFNGFHLDRNDKTCVEKGRIRFLVSFKVYDQNVDLAHLDTTRYNALKAGIESTLLQLFQPRLYKAENLKVLSFKPAAVVQFHFFGESEDSHRAKALLEENLKRGRIGRYAVDRTYMDFEWEPALSIKGMEISEKLPLVEGSELNLACIVQGSEDMKVRWFKDGSPIDSNTIYRNIRFSVTPKNSKEQYTAMINIEKSNVLDTGEFTCQVQDWGIIQNKSFQVTVVKVEVPVVIPLTLTVLIGSPFVITCLAEEDLYGTFGYNWLKNDRILNPSLEPEMVEDLFPGGSRLVVQEAQESAKYTCLTTNTAGTAKRSNIVTVLTTDGGRPMCLAEKDLQIVWRQAAANTEAIQPCPKGYKGEVKRHCVMQRKNVAIWASPDYSSCLSTDLLLVKNKLQSMKLGYMVADIAELLRDLRSCLWSLRDSAELGLGEPVVDLLDGIQEYQRAIGNLYAIDMQNYSQVFMDIAAFLVESPRLIQKQSHVIKLHQLILSFGLHHGASLSTETFHLLQRPSLVLEVGRIRNDVHKFLRFPSRPSSTAGNYPMEAIPDWLTDSVELEFDSWLLNKVTGRNDSMSIAVVFYRNLSAFLPERFVTKPSFVSYETLKEPDLEYQLHSRLVAVAMHPGQRRTPGSHSKRSLDSKLKVKARLEHLNHTVNHRILWNISCGMADFSEGNVQFSMEGCTPVQTGLFSLCQCDRVGTYVVLLTTYAPTEEYHTHEAFDTNAGIGCAICAFFVCLTFFILLVLWRKIRGAVTALKIQFCLAVIAAYTVILKSLQNSSNQEKFHYSVPLVQFFLTAAFSIQLCVSLTVYFDFVGFKTMRYKIIKFAILAWAVPLIVVGSSLAAQVPDGFKLNSWWIQVHTKSFYAFSVSIIIIVMLQIMLVVAIRSEMRYYSTSKSKGHTGCSSRWKLVTRSLVITFFLLLASVSSILYVNSEEVYFTHTFGAFSSLFGFIVFLCYTACSENVHSLCSSKATIEENSDYDLKQQLGLKANRSPFENFLKPELVGGSYISGKTSSIDTEERIRQFQKLGGNFTRKDEHDWKNIGNILLQKEDPTCLVRDFTVHQQQSSAGTLTKDGITQDESMLEMQHKSSVKVPGRIMKHRHEASDVSAATFQLQQLDESPKSSHLQLQDDEGSYELNHHGSAPDILETTSRQSTLEKKRVTIITPDSALAKELPKVACSTFRQVDSGTPARLLDVITNKPGGGRPEYQKQESDSDDQKPGMHSTPPCPPIQSMIGDDKLISGDSSGVEGESAEESSTLLKKRFVKKVGPNVGLNVPIPKVPELMKLGSDPDSNAQGKKGWNMTAV